jgi:hypothetical protein
MLGNANELAAIFSAITSDILLAGTNGYVIDQIPSYLDIVAGSFTEYVNDVDTGVAPDVVLDYNGVPNQIRWNVTGGDVNADKKSLKFTVKLNSSYDGGPTSSLPLNTSATLYYKDKDGLDQYLPFSPMPTGWCRLQIEMSVYSSTASSARPRVLATPSDTNSCDQLTAGSSEQSNGPDPMFPLRRPVQYRDLTGCKPLSGLPGARRPAEWPLSHASVNGSGSIRHGRV